MGKEDREGRKKERKEKERKEKKSCQPDGEKYSLPAVLLLVRLNIFFFHTGCFSSRGVLPSQLFCHSVLSLDN